MSTAMFKEETGSYTTMVVDAIQSKIGDQILTCPVSLDSQWEVQEYPGFLPASTQIPGGQALTDMNLSFPLAVVMCKTCGYSMIFNLYALGVGDDLGFERA